MNGTTQRASRTGINWRYLGWTTAAVLLLVPLVAMQFTSEVNWDETDFLFAGAMFAAVIGLLELAVRMSRHRAFRAGFALAVLGGFLTIWINLAVGIVGSEDNPFNLWFFGVLAVGAFGSLVARFRAGGMALTMVMMAVAQMAVFVIALATGAGFILPVTLFFGFLWIGAAVLFRRAAREGRLEG